MFPSIAPEETVHGLPQKYRLFIWLSFALIGGFLVVALASYAVSRNAIRHSLADQTLPLTGDNIYSEIQKDLLRPVFISSLMANDTFMRDWILGGEKDTGQIVHYLQEMKAKYATITSFLVSAPTRRYYYAGGELKRVREDEARDRWFFRVRTMQQPYEINVDPDMANRDAMTIFVNYRVLDYDSNFIGATGVGLTLDAVSRVVDSYEQRFHRQVYFTDAAGNVVLTGKAQRALRGSIRQLPGIATVAAQILNRDARPARHSYSLGHATYLLNTRYLPELNWYLIVQQNETDEIVSVRRVLYFNLAIAALATLLVLTMVWLAVRRYHQQLERLATEDTLTGCFNRRAFELLFAQALVEGSRHPQELALLLCDLDYFKQINDEYGHLAGDAALRGVAAIVRGSLREADILVRWGGEEFLVLLKGCPLSEAASVAEKLRTRVAGAAVAPPLPVGKVSLSIGVVAVRPGDSQDGVFARVDRALYAAKDGGRNRIVIAPQD